jgi:hypothetical protein
MTRIYIYLFIYLFLFNIHLSLVQDLSENHCSEREFLEQILFCNKDYYYYYDWKSTQICFKVTSYWAKQ